MKAICWTVPESWANAQLKTFLRKEKGVSAQVLSQAKQMDGGILLNGTPVFATALLHPGDQIQILSQEKISEIPPEKLPLEVLFEDDHLLLVNKPSGMPMYPCPGHDSGSLANAVAWYLDHQGEPSVFYPVYRLDKDTTGALLLAKHSFAASFLGNHVRKEYWGICQGDWCGEGTESGSIGLLPGHTVQRCVREDGDPSVTHWKTEICGKGHTALWFSLETGRTHQIRVHMSARGTPLAGDTLYGGNREHICRQALHCRFIQFIHPVSGAVQSMEAPVPPDLKALYAWISGQNPQSRR